MWQRKMLASALIVLAPPAAWAQRDVAPVLELHARGELAIDPDGHVSDFRLDGKLNAEVTAVVERRVRDWLFQPIVVDGKAVTAKTSLHLVLTASPANDHPELGNYVLKVEHVTFGEPVKATHVQPPSYPQSAVRARLGAKVVLSLRLDEQGHVVEAMPYQTSLDKRARNETEAEHWRQVFERASLQAVKSWQYEMNERIDGKAVGMWARVPFLFTMLEDGAQPKPDRWRPFIPGPVHARPDEAQAELADNRDLSGMGQDDVLPLGSAFHLKNDVAGKAL